MIELFQLAAQLQDACVSQGWRFLIVMKAFADRARDWVDVENVAARQRSHLDWPYIERQLSPLAELKDSLEIMERIRRLRKS